MKKQQKKEQKKWQDQLRELFDACCETLEIVDGVDEDMSWGELRSLRNKLVRVKRMADQLKSSMCGTPASKILSLNRRSMTEQEYYLLCATGCKLFTANELGLSPVSDHEAFIHCCYEDDEKVCYIVPTEKPPVRNEEKKTGKFTIRMRLGCSPEELHVKYLRPEQKKFFQELLPDVYDRFQKD